MKILFIAAPFPYPPDTGSRNLIFHWLDAACRNHDVDLIAFEERGAGDRRIPELPNLRIEVLPVSVKRTFAARIARFAASIVRGIPATSLVYIGRRAVGRILAQVSERSYDAVVLAENVIAGFGPLLEPLVPVVLFKHSVQAADARDDHKRLGMNPLRAGLTEWIVCRFERRTCRAATVVCCVNQEDAEDLNRRYALPRAPKVVPIGVELKRFQPRSVDPGGTVVGFFGNLTWGANVDAVTWFVSAVLPLIWRENPETVFHIIGPGAETLALGTQDPRIVRLGPVPQEEIAAAMRDVTVGIISVISGTGVRLKLLEMLSMGIPAVSTSLGRLGTNCEHGVHLLVADDPASFASAIIRLFSDAGLRHRLSRAGAEIALMHSWESAYPRIWNAIESAARQEPRHSALDPEPKRMQTL